jgi:hypothetical protein
MRMATIEAIDRASGMVTAKGSFGRVVDVVTPAK